MPAHDGVIEPHPLSLYSEFVTGDIGPQNLYTILTDGAAVAI